MESGLRSDAAISMVNSLLETGCDRVVSATVDLCSIDLFAGKASFLKLGAVSSIIKRRGKVETVVGFIGADRTCRRYERRFVLQRS